MRNETEVALLARYNQLSARRMEYISGGEKADMSRANLIMKEMTLIMNAIQDSEVPSDISAELGKE